MKNYQNILRIIRIQITSWRLYCAVLLSNIALPLIARTYQKWTMYRIFYAKVFQKNIIEVCQNTIRSDSKGTDSNTTSIYIDNDDNIESVPGNENYFCFLQHTIHLRLKNTQITHKLDVKEYNCNTKVVLITLFYNKMFLI